MVLDAVNNEVQRRDSKGAVSLQEYDTLNRPTKLWAHDTVGGLITLREQVTYGDKANRTTARENNTLGKPVEYFDEAGVVTTPEYDFKGNLLDKTRKVISDVALAAGWTADWSNPNAEADLDPAEYVTSTQYDALNRTTQVLYPADVNGHRATLMPTYNRAGALEQVALDGNVYVQRIAYNAKGQRVFIAYGNGMLTRYAYDPQTFRLARVRSESFTRNGNTYQPSGSLLQDLSYDYDVGGNTLAIHDRIPGCGLPADPNKLDRAFEYDSLARLTWATSRECNLPPIDPIWQDSPRCQDVTSTRRFIQTYSYDAAGNMTELKHVAPNNGSFTRTFQMLTGNNRLDTVTVGQGVYDYLYDENGNMTQETVSRRFTWDHADRLQRFQATDGAGNQSVVARYLYDSGGIRVKKWIRKNGNNAKNESTVYIEGLFEHQRWSKNGGGQNNHLHVMDNQSRVAILREGAVHPDDAGTPMQYHLSDHLGSSSVVVDGTGNLTNREEFYPYGETSFGSFEKKRYRYAGKERDGESGLQYYGVRYFSASAARWVSADRFSLMEVRPNAYVAFLDNPLKYTDPDGRFSISNHYNYTNNAALKLGYDSASADFVAHFASVYADHPESKILAANNAVGITSKQHSFRVYFDYTATGNSQDTSSPQYSMWHAMAADGEKISTADATRRGQEFGWSKIISAGEAFKGVRTSVTLSPKDNTYVLSTKTIGSIALKHQSILGDLGQGIHALQDAIRHKGVDMAHHSIPADIRPPSAEATQAESVTYGALLVFELFSGDDRHLALISGTTIDVSGASAEHSRRFRILSRRRLTKPIQSEI